MDWILKRFEELTVDELYDALRLRVDVFVVEQNCPYAEIDGIDRQSLHLIGTESGRTLAYMRIFRKPDEENTVQLGRIVTAVRGKGLGKELLRRGIRAAAETMHADVIYLEAQCRARGFYEREGFCACSEPFLEDGIEHIGMRLDLKTLPA